MLSKHAVYQRHVHLLRKLVLTAASAALGFWTAGALLGGNQAAQQPAPDSQRVVAVVNGEAILESEVQAGMRSLGGADSGAPSAPDDAAPTEAPAAGLRDQVVEMIIGSRLIEQFVAQQQIAVEPKEVEDFLARLRENAEQQGGSFAEFLQAQGQTEESLRRRVTGMLGWQKYVQSRATDEVLQDYFQKNQRHFDGTQVRASQILLKVPPDVEKEQLQELLGTLQDLRKRIVENEISFADAARQHSQSPSGRRGGDLGFIPRRRRMYEPFARAAFDLQVGEVSEPVLTPQGLHLITVTDVKAGDKQFSDVREEVQRAYARELEAEITAQQREKANIEIAGAQLDEAPPLPKP